MIELSEFSYGATNLGRVVLGIIDLPGPSDAALRIDEVGAPQDSIFDNVTNTLLAIRTVRVNDLTIWVGQQREVESELASEVVVTIPVISRHTVDNGTYPIELRKVVAESAGLRRAARRIVLRVEVKHRPRAPRIVQVPADPVLVGEFKIRGHHSGLKHHVPPAPPYLDAPTALVGMPTRETVLPLGTAL